MPGEGYLTCASPSVSQSRDEALAGGYGVFVLGPLEPHLRSITLRMTLSPTPCSLISITSRVTPVQMSQPKLIVSSRTRPSGSTAST